MNIIDRIKELASARYISLAELERRTGLSSGSVTKWGKSSPSVDKINKVADFFNVSVDYLLGREKNTESQENSAEEIASFFRKVTQDIKMTEEEEEELENDFKDYMEFRAQKLKKKKGN